MTRKPTILAATLAAAALLAGCGGGGDGSAAAPAADGATAGAKTVEVATFDFQPDPIEISVGDTVTWVNEDETVHTVTSGTRKDRDGRYDHELTAEGGKATQTYDKPGTYDYFCSIHSGPGMTAKVVVR